MKRRLELQEIAKTLGGIPIWATFEGSVAHQAGLRYGDIILSVNGQPTPTVDDYFKAKNLDTKEMTLTYFRSGETYTITLALQKSIPVPDMSEVLAKFVATRARALVGEMAKRASN